MTSFAVLDPPLLRTASIFVRYCIPDSCGELPHVTAQLDALLNNFSGLWTIVTAYGHTRSLRWVKHFAAREPKETKDPFYRRWLLNRTAELAAWNGDLETIQWLMDTYLPKEHLQYVVAAAAARGHLQILKWLHENHRERVTFGGFEMAEALKSDQKEVVEWLRENSHVDGRACKFSVLCAASNAGNLDIVKWLDNGGKTQYKLYGQLPRGSFTLPRRNAVPILKYYSSTRRDLGVIKPEMLLEAATKGNLEVVKWLHSEQELAISVEAMRKAASNGHSELIQWLLKQEPEVCDGSVMENAARYGSLEIVKWLHSSWSGNVGVEVMDTAAMYGHLDLVKWLHNYRTEGCSEFAIDGAALNGHLVVVKWLHEHRKEGCRSFAMDTAAGNGHLDVVKWLHEHRSEGCSTKAMDGAARNGHLDVVKWLHENRSEGGTALAMDSAAQCGHLDVVIWLHRHRSEGCTTQAMDVAATFGHIDVVKWLHRHRKEGCTTKAMDGAAQYGHLHVVRWLHFNLDVGCTSAAMTNAILQGHFDVVMFLHNHLSEGCKFHPDLVQPTLRKAVASFFCSSMREVALELQQWTRRNFRDEVLVYYVLEPQFDWRSRCQQSTQKYITGREFGYNS